MNAGVSTSPCAVVSTPARAAPSVAVTRKLMAQASRVGDSSGVTTEQPSGTVTLVFTDIEGSTRLLDALGPEEYRRALGEHREAVRGAFDRHGGYEVDTAGDGFFYAFPTAAEAVRAVARGARGARGRADPDQGRRPHRRADPRPAEVRRARRAPGGPDHGGGARRAGAALPHDPRPARRELRGPRPRRAPPQGSLRAAAPLPARGARVPAAEDPAPDEPSRPGDGVPRPRAGAGRGGRAAPERRPPAHPHRPRRHRQDPARAPGRGRGRRRLRRRRLVGAACARSATRRSCFGRPRRRWT